MGKIVKYCTVCEEGFAEKFSFCPNCAATLTAYEMNPVFAGMKNEDAVKIFEPAEEVAAEQANFEAPATIELPEVKTVEANFEPEPPAFLSSTENESDFLEIEAEAVEEPTVTAPAVTIPAVFASSDEIKEETVIEEPLFEAPETVAPTVAPTNFESYQQTYPRNSFSDTPKSTANFAGEKRADNKTLGGDGFYSVTLVEEKNSGTRNMLLLGAALIVLGGAIFGLIASIYNANAYVGALEDDLNNIVYVGDEAPAEEPEMPEPKNKDKGGGGGGGGDNDPNPVSKGVLASQSQKPQIPPNANMEKVTNPELVLKPETQGNRIEKPTNERYGDPNALTSDTSNGSGSGGGQGSGSGRGQGSGQGTGAGSGIGSGNGSGIGNGNGSGRGDGDNGGEPPAIKVPPSGPTIALQITSKPRANYTDAARQNQVQGTVRLRVTFLANGTIGSISAVNGLPNGLTEQAIAAARNIRFTPAMKNGQPYAVTKQLEYSFTLY